MSSENSFLMRVWKRFISHRVGVGALFVFLIFAFIGIYAPFFASSKPFVVRYEGEFYFPFFRYLFFPGFYTKQLDLFFNLLMFTLPFFIWASRTKKAFFFVLCCHLALFGYILTDPFGDPASDPFLNRLKVEKIKQKDPRSGSWEFALEHMTPYEKLNRLLKHQRDRLEHEKIAKQMEGEEELENGLGTLWEMKEDNLLERLGFFEKELKRVEEDSEIFQLSQQNLNYLKNRESWLSTGVEGLSFIWMPLLRPYHWEEDAGGARSLNAYISFIDLTRINRKDLVSALIFGIRISLTVGLASVLIALTIGLPIGSIAGYFGGRMDIIISRMLEIWESLPTFFMLLLVVSMLQSKSIFIVILVIGIFGWTGFSRFLRAEFFKQRRLSYVDACFALGYPHRKIIFSHILPNAIPPVLTLLPFFILGAITSEAGLSFLGLGEEGSCSLGVLMDEGRAAFPAESYLLWPPAIVLTVLLVSIALIGDALRDALDPKVG